MKRVFNLFAAFAVLLIQGLGLASPHIASAHDGEEHSEETMVEEPTTQEDSAAPAVYKFTTPAGCSLSLLARRAIQLFDQEDDTVTLTTAAAIYAETNIVQKLGSRWLEIGEKVEISQTLVDEYAQKSKDLSAETLAAWQTYASYADFNLEQIKPDNAPPTKAEKEAAEVEKAAEEAKAQAEQEAETNKGKTDKSNTVYWGLVGFSTLAILYYLLSGRKNRSGA